MNKNLEEIKRLLANGEKRIVIDLLQDNYDPFHKMMEQYIKEGHLHNTGWTKNLPNKDSKFIFATMNNGELSIMRSSVSFYNNAGIKVDTDLYFKATDFFKIEKGIKKKLEL